MFVIRLGSIVSVLFMCVPPHTHKHSVDFNYLLVFAYVKHKHGSKTQNQTKIYAMKNVTLVHPYSILISQPFINTFAEVNKSY